MVHIECLLHISYKQYVHTYVWILNAGIPQIKPRYSQLTGKQYICNDNDNKRLTTKHFCTSSCRYHGELTKDSLLENKVPKWSYILETSITTTIPHPPPNHPQPCQCHLRITVVFGYISLTIMYTLIIVDLNYQIILEDSKWSCLLCVKFEIYLSKFLFTK